MASSITTDDGKVVRLPDGVDPDDVNGYELLAWDRTGDKYSGTIVKTSNRKRHTYVYIDQDTPLGPQGPAGLIP